MNDHVIGSEAGVRGFATRRKPGFWRTVGQASLLGVLLGGGLLGCAGYRVGSVAGKDLQGISTVFVPTAKNQSYEPGIQVTVTNAILRKLDNDGTLKTVQNADADSELTVNVISTNREAIRGNTLDPQATEEYELFVHAEVTFFNRKLGKKILDKVKVEGSTKFFVQSDQVESERQAFPMAAEDLANHVVSLVVEGW